MSPRKFNFICIATLIAVVVVAMAMVAMSPQNVSTEVPPSASTPVTDGDAASAIGYMSLGLGLSLTIVADMGLMTLGLVILFKEENPDRYQAP